jgi:hypothetical protein
MNCPYETVTNGACRDRATTGGCPYGIIGRRMGGSRTRPYSARVVDEKT